MIIDSILSLNGIKKANLLDDLDKNIILSLEEKNNIGVKEVISRKKVILAVHNSDFREPQQDIVINGAIPYFPSIPFPELNGAIVSCPGWDVHEYLKEKFNIQERDASLLIGID